MAEVEQANTQSAISPQTAPGIEPYCNPVSLTDNSARLIDYQSILASDITQQVPERVLPEQSVPASSDDEVEFVFSVPRRRKKRHRRLELPSRRTNTSSASPISSAGVIGARSSPEKLVPDMAPSLDHCTEPDEMNRARCHSAKEINKTATFDTFLQPLNVPQSGLPVLSPSHISQTTPFKISPPWYAKSILPPPSPTSPYYHAKSTTFTTPEQDNGKKRKHKDSSENSNHVSPYMSSASMYLPRPKGLPSNSNNSSLYGHTGFVDFLEDPNVPTTLGGVPLPLPPHRPVIPGWQDFTWKPSDYSPPKRASSIGSRASMFSNINNDPNWHRKYYFGAVDPNCVNSQQVPIGTPPSERYVQDMVSPKTIPLTTQTAPASYSSIQRKLVPELRHMPTKVSTSSTNICPVQPSSVISSKYSQPTPPITPLRHTCPSPFPRPQVTAADIRRKPSLYRIPAWPHSMDNNKASSYTALFERQNQTGDTENNDIISPQIKTPQQARPTASHTQDSVSSPTQIQAPHSSRPQASTSVSASSSKHSPNLIIDIAQTSQDTFPFAAVAARHNKPIQKVFDTFSAIIQLPLLKQAADGRRHGPLGSERMRMYREAKRAMERANGENEKEENERKQGQ
ncbi:uncharacterized protein Bfra_007181 [Botrytis fragariae]|uniref:Uncharacterized protein n=1 Tax=Botrytis fragariae TaxID=1964551 RepID=A0A8H6AIM3_9HELO|nr:uncharacterized protein Bfra_007181 [Botrytis fragariae]KAF5867985.1 hypothetical protein Bfra_007181 [Botrytis fragariae]